MSSDGSASSETGDFLDIQTINTFYGPSHILHDVSFSVGQNEIVTILGRNGAGKTTTLRSIMGLTPPKNGTIVFKGEEIQGLPPHAIRKRGISWVPEDRRVFPTLSVHENLALVKATGATAEQIDDVYSLFPKLNDRREQKAGTLSGGEQQMLTIARSLIGPETEILLLDEPTEGLAPQIVENLKDIVRDLAEQGYTILLVEQNAEVALELASRAYILETGHIELEDSTRTLRTNRDILESYLGVR